MTGIIGRIMGRLRLASRPAASVRRRGWDAAAGGRLVSGWMTDGLSASAALRGSLATMRSRCRDLERNNVHARRILRLVEEHVVGPRGIRLQARVRDDDGTLDVDACRRIEDAWAEWGEAGVCTMDGRLSWAGAQRLIARTIARDGEVVIRLIRGRRAGNRYGLALQLLEADHLDEHDDRDLSGGRVVRSGVEMDAWGRPIALHLHARHPGDAIAASRLDRRIRVPMRDALHPYVPERIGQVRGVPWMVAAVMSLRQLGEYQRSEVVAARVAAAKMGFFVQDPDADPELAAAPAADDMSMEAEPGVLEMLPPGYRFQAWDPQHPNSAYAEFVRAMLREVAAGCGVSYASLSGDLTQTSYSSLRQGALMERDAWRVVQQWMIDAVLRPIYRAWLDMALLTGALAPLPTAKAEKFGRHIWRPRGWEWVDPYRETRAALDAIGGRIESRSSVLARRGEDMGDLLEEIAQERELAAQYGVDLPDPGRRVGGGAGGVDGNAKDDDDG